MLAPAVEVEVDGLNPDVEVVAAAAVVVEVVEDGSYPAAAAAAAVKDGSYPAAAAAAGVGRRSFRLNPAKTLDAFGRFTGRSRM
jgi:hypothetical protein